MVDTETVIQHIVTDMATLHPRGRPGQDGVVECIPRRMLHLIRVAARPAVIPVVAEQGDAVPEGALCSVIPVSR